jgi:hypothetical protein
MLLMLDLRMDLLRGKRFPLGCVPPLACSTRYPFSVNRGIGVWLGIATIDGACANVWGDRCFGTIPYLHILIAGYIVVNIN